MFIANLREDLKIVFCKNQIVGIIKLLMQKRAVLRMKEQYCLISLNKVGKN